jgi:hypothetical protein
LMKPALSTQSHVTDAPTVALVCCGGLPLHAASPVTPRRSVRSG